VLLISSFYISKKNSHNDKDFKRWIFARFSFFSIIFIVLITLIIAVDLTKILQHPLKGHDSLVYGIMGKMLYTEKSLEPIWVDDFSTQGFIYSVVKKPPSYSLFLTWEKIIGFFINGDTDLYFKSTTLYYSILIIVIFYHLLSKINFHAAILGTLVLATAVTFFLTLFRHHVDSFRIFFQSVSLIFLFYSIKYKDNFNIFMLGMFSGFAAFTHTIGLGFAGLNAFAFFIFINENFRYRILKTLFVVGSILVFGASHQISILIWGRNWIF
jgi:hypothetical protein